jgi:hypothetical protein
VGAWSDIFFSFGGICVIKAVSQKVDWCVIMKHNSAIRACRLREGSLLKMAVQWNGTAEKRCFLVGGGSTVVICL